MNSFRKNDIADTLWQCLGFTQEQPWTFLYQFKMASELILDKHITSYLTWLNLNENIFLNSLQSGKSYLISHQL